MNKVPTLKVEVAGVYVYKITNKINGKAYVGQTISKPKDRWKVHCSARSGNGRNAIKAAILKYGRENFEFQVITKASTRDELDALEKKYIEELNTIAPNGYNLMTGGNAPRHSEETRKKMSKAGKGRVPWNKGLTAEDPRVASYVRRGKDSHTFGKALHNKPHSEETKKLISELQRHKWVKVRCVETGEIFDNIHLAAKKVGGRPGNVSKNLNTKRRVKGFTFERLSNG